MTYLQSEEVPAGIHEHRAEDRPRRTRDGPIPKLVERIGRTQDHARTQLAEICSNIDWPRRFGRCKTVYQALCKQENSFFSRGPPGPADRRTEGTQANHIPVSDLPGGPCGLRAFGTKTAPLLIRCAVAFGFFCRLTKGLPVCVTGARGSPRLSRTEGIPIAILL